MSFDCYFGSRAELIQIRSLGKIVISHCYLRPCFLVSGKFLKKMVFLLDRQTNNFPLTPSIQDHTTLGLLDVVSCSQFLLYHTREHTRI
ncbi:hypothetical protein Hanom_Chr09g00780261 [Helianthus anomalus]